MIPKENGYYFPAEWEPHRATWLTLPLNDESWPGLMDEVYDVFFQFVKVITLSEVAAINVQNDDMLFFTRDSIRRYRIDPESVELYLHPSNDCWCRDHGPAFLRNEENEKLLVNWKYNAWGEKYAWELDDRIPALIAEARKLPVVEVDMVQEGGSIDVNGWGSLITTRSCLLNPNRNPRLTETDIEQHLKNYYGVEQVLWLEKGISGDDTDGHVDDITRFINEDTVLTVMEPDPDDPDHEVLRHNRELLSGFRLPDGKPLQIIELPMPEPVYARGNRLPASYANFYITNSHVVVPVFLSRHDDRALDIIQSCFPERTVVGIDSRTLVRGLGSFHCLCQQEPV